MGIRIRIERVEMLKISWKQWRHGLIVSYNNPFHQQVGSLQFQSEADDKPKYGTVVYNASISIEPPMSVKYEIIRLFQDDIYFIILKNQHL